MGVNPGIMRRRSRLVLGSVLALEVLAFVALLVPAPIWAMRLMSGPWLLNYAEGSPNSLDLSYRNAVGLWIEKGIAAKAVRDPGGPDAQRIGAMLVQMKPFLISQTEITHGPAIAHTGIAGIGWCNHVNGFAAEVLSHYYPKAESFAVNNGATSHTFGRVWTSAEWLYFDAWADEIVVFRWRGTPDYLFRSRQTQTMTPTDVVNVANAYNRADHGYTLRRFRPTVLGQLIEDMGNRFDHGSDTAPGADEQFVPSARLPRPTIHDAAAKEYIAARFEQLSGDKAEARRRYAAVSGPSAYSLAARGFERRLAQ